MLYMTQMSLDTRALMHIADRRLLFQHSLDMGYLVHSQLCELFGDELAPKPFMLGENDGPRLQVTGYSSVPAEKLAQYAQTFAQPVAYRVVDWDAFASKPMPAAFPLGKQLSFHLRACPVVRKSRGSQFYKAGREVDIFLSEVARCGPDVQLNRHAIYTAWLENYLSQQGGAQCSEVQVIQFHRSRLLRRNKSRAGIAVERPEVVFEGNLEVTDPERFQQLLTRGVGRHRAFGFGMLLLLPRGQHNAKR